MRKYIKKLIKKKKKEDTKLTKETSEKHYCQKLSEKVA